MVPNDFDRMFPIFLINPIPNIKKVIFNEPATIIFWEDGTKTVAKCQEEDKYDREKGMLVCMVKKAMGSKWLNKNLDYWISSEKRCGTCKYDHELLESSRCMDCLYREGHRNWEPKK